MSKRKARINPVDPDAPDQHEELERHAALIVEDLIPAMASRWNLCLGCFATEIMQQLHAALATLEAHQEADDRIGEPRGSA
jgi:hypothetical protein